MEGREQAMEGGMGRVGSGRDVAIKQYVRGSEKTFHFMQNVKYNFLCGA